MGKSGKKILNERMEKISSNRQLLISLTPSYVVWVISCYIASCLWYYLTYTFEEEQMWLFNFEGEKETTSDKFWLSAYYVTTTITTTGYGDLLPATTIEYLITSLLTIFGAAFFFEIFRKINKRFKDDENHQKTIHEKKNLMIDLKNNHKLFESEEGQKIYKYMQFLIDDYQKFEF
jgi:Na+/melibiose symporter-like transporter